MKRIVILSMLLLSCGQNQEDTIPAGQLTAKDRIDAINLAIDNQATFNKEIILEKPTLLVVEMDSVEIEELRLKLGDEYFHTATDDLMWYHAQMLKKMDSLNIPVLYEEVNLRIVTSTTSYEILKDSTFSLLTYFFFNGDTLTRKEVFDL